MAQRSRGAPRSAPEATRERTNPPFPVTFRSAVVEILYMLAERLSSMLAERSKIDEGKLALDTKFEELMAEARRDSRSELTAEETAKR